MYPGDLIREREREREKKRRNKFSAMKDSLFLRSNILAREEESGSREEPLLEEGENTISSFITSPPINQYTLRFPIALERFISSIPHPWGAVIFVCTGCALSQYKYRGAQDLAGSVTGCENERSTFSVAVEGRNGIIPPQQGRWEWSSSVYKRD